jgi:hypothetical protein
MALKVLGSMGLTGVYDQSPPMKRLLKSDYGMMTNKTLWRFVNEIITSYRLHFTLLEPLRSGSGGLFNPADTRAIEGASKKRGSVG